MTDPIDTDAIRARAEAATEGPWEAREGDLEGKPASEYVRTLLANREADGTSSGRLFLTLAPNPIDPERGATVVPALTGDGPQAEANATFIAHARTDIPALVTALAEARAERDFHRARADVLLAKVGGGVALRGGKPGDYWAEWHRTHCAAAEGAANERARAEAAEAELAEARAQVERVRALAERWQREADERGPDDRVYTRGVAALIRAALAPADTTNDTTEGDRA